MSRKRALVADRFWSKVRKTEGCWEWTARTAYGYGVFCLPGGLHGTNVRAHRLSWEMHNGPIPGCLLVLHKCDNRKCVRPDHLFLGTQQDNVDDMYAKGRNGDWNGERHGQAILTLDQVRHIRSSNKRACELAADFHVTESTIYNVKAGRSWRCAE